MLKFFWKNLDHFKTRYIWLLLVAVLDGLAVFAIPTLLSEFTRGGLDTSRLQELVVLLLALYVASLCFAWVIRRFGEALAQEFENHLRFSLYKRYVVLPYLELKNYHSGYFLSLASKVAASYKYFINMTFWTLVRGLTVMLFFLFVMARDSLASALINTGILVIFLFLSTFYASRISVQQKELNLRYAAMMQVFADFLTNVFTVKQLGILDFSEGKISESNRFSSEQIKKVQKSHANKWIVLHTIFGLSFIGTIVYLLWLISLGRVSEAILIVLIGGFLQTSGNLGRLSEMIVQGMELKVNVQSLEEILGENKAGKSPTQKLPDFSSLEVQGASFRYPGTKHVLTYPDFVIKSGKVTCLVGESGIGKSSLLNVLQGHLELAGGRILLNQKVVSSESLRKYSKLFTHISQEAELFNLTVRENLALGRKVDDKILLEELRLVGMDEWFGHLEKGLDSILGEKGTRLSAGQKQRINIIRGMLLDRPVALLDEPTSHLDTETEKVVVEYLKEKLKGKTALIVTHRDAILELADEVIELA